MKYNNNGSELERMKLDEDALEAVSGGTGGGGSEGNTYVVKGHFKQLCYNNQNSGWGHYAVGTINSGKQVYGVTQCSSQWMRVPVAGNYQNINIVKVSWFKEANTNYFVYMEAAGLERA